MLPWPKDTDVRRQEDSENWDASAGALSVMVILPCGDEVPACLDLDTRMLTPLKDYFSLYMMTIQCHFLPKYTMVTFLFSGVFFSNGLI